MIDRETPEYRAAYRVVADARNLQGRVAMAEEAVTRAAAKVGKYEALLEGIRQSLEAARAARAEAVTRADAAATNAEQITGELRDEIDLHLASQGGGSIAQAGVAAATATN